MKRLLTILTTFAILFSFQTLSAADRWSLDLHTAAAFATDDIGDADLGTGFGIEGNLYYRFMEHLSVFAGWGWHGFSTDDSFAGADNDLEETGYNFGLLFVHPLGSLPLDYSLRVGGMYSHLELEDDSGNITADSGHGLGWMLGAGLAIRLNEKWRLTPDVRYRSLSRDIDISGVNSDLDLNYFSVGVGISRSF